MLHTMASLKVIVITLLSLTFANANSVPFCKMRIDLTFVVDSSVSVPVDDFQKQIQFVDDIVNFLDVGPDATKVAVVTFSQNVQPRFGFNDYTTKAEVLKAINDIPHTQGRATRTYLALNEVHRNIYAPGNGERSNAVDVVVVLTDGETNSGSFDRHTYESGKEATKIEAKILKDRPAYVFAIGVGQKVNVDELNDISSDPDDRFTITLDSFDDLNQRDLQYMLVKRACYEQITTPSPTPRPTPPAPVKTTPANKIEECKETLADIFFILDESSSLQTHTNFQKELNFAITLVDELPVVNDQCQVGVMKFGDRPTIEFYLDSYHTREEIAARINTITWKGGNTFLDRALKLLREQGMIEERGSRANQDVPQIIIVITDGVSTNPAATRRELLKLPSDVLRFAVGVGPRRDSAELNKIASSSSNVFEVEDLDSLVKIKQALLTRICDESNNKVQEFLDEKAGKDIF